MAKKITAKKAVKKAVAKKIAAKKIAKGKSFGKKNYADLKHKAESLYMDTQLSQKEISEVLGVSEITVSNWANATEPSWDEIRKLRSVGRPQALAKLYQRLIDQVDEKANSDAVYKTLLIIKELEDKRIALPEIINTMRDFSTFLMGENLDFAKELIPFQTSFINKKVNERK